MRKMFYGSILLMILFFQGCNAGIGSLTGSDRPIVGDPPQKVDDTFTPVPGEYSVDVWVKNLHIPWSIVFLSDHKALVTERKGSVRVVENGVVIDEPYKIIDAVEHVGEGGLMGMARHPEYPDKPYLYVMYTYRKGSDLFNKVERFRDTGSTLEADRVIVDTIPGHRVHNGGRIAFGPDGMLYITTGDVWQAETAQDLNNLGGKILRYTPEGTIPGDNPFAGSPVFSLGHRNPQGLAWHKETGTLFSSEHGPSGEFGLRDRDIINSIKKGGNYGWPVVLGNANVAPYIDPVIMWPRATPPAGMAFWENRLYVATLRSEALVRIDLAPSNDTWEVTGITRLFASDWTGGVYGRLREAVVGPDNALYVATSNRDGRGRPAEDDDRILRIRRKQQPAE